MMRSFSYDALRRVSSLVDDPERVDGMMASAQEMIDGELDMDVDEDLIPLNMALPAISDPHGTVMSRVFRRQ